jgi:hypothetical protein
MSLSASIVRVGLGAATLLLVSTTAANAVADGCAVVLSTPDGFLAVRAGPGTSHREIYRLRPGQAIVTNHISDGPYAGRWWRIGAVMDRPGENARPLVGWIHSRFVRSYEC